MANWTILKASIANAITTNGNQEITGALLQQVLNNIVNSIGENATFAGVATPATNPGVPDGPVFYVATTTGSYPNFGVVVENKVAIFYNVEAQWEKINLEIPLYDNINQEIIGITNAIQLLQDEIEDLPSIREKLYTLVINDLTTGGADKALSAEMGKELGEEVAELEKEATTEHKGLMSAEDKNNLGDASNKIDNTIMYFPSKNLFNVDDADVMMGYYQAAGSPVENEFYNLTGYIPVKAGKTYHIGKGGTTPQDDIDARFVSFFTGEKTIKNYITDTATILVPEDVKYMRLSLATMHILNYVMVEEGDSYTGFVPYKNRFVIKDPVEIPRVDSIIGKREEINTLEADVNVLNTSLSLWKTFYINAEKDNVVRVVISSDIVPSRVIAYENVVGSNAHELSTRGSTEFVCKTTFMNLLIYGIVPNAGDIHIEVETKRLSTGMVAQVEALEKSVGTLSQDVAEIKEVIGKGYHNLIQNVSVDVTKTSLYSWKDFDVVCNSGSVVKVTIDTDTSPSRVIAYENVAGQNQHELYTEGSTEFYCTSDCTKILIYGWATVVGTADITVECRNFGTGVIGRVEEIESNTTSIFTGKKMAFLGSSITQGKDWVDKVANYFKSEYVNCGVGGSAIVNESDSSMSNPKRLTGEYSNVTDPNTGEITYNGVALPLDSEVIIIEGGVNDWARNWPLGERKIKHTDGVLDVDDKTFYGACHQTFHNILQRCPNATIIVVGDVFGKMPNRSVFTDKYGLYNDQGLLITDYADALVDVAGMWGMRGFNFGRIVGVNDLNVMQMGDGLHPNAKYRERIANAIYNFMHQVKKEETVL